MTDQSGLASYAGPSVNEKVKAPLLKVRDAAALLGMSTITVRRRVRDSTLPHFKNQGTDLFQVERTECFHRIPPRRAFRLN